MKKKIECRNRKEMARGYSAYDVSSICNLYDMQSEYTGIKVNLIYIVQKAGRSFLRNSEREKRELDTIN